MYVENICVYLWKWPTIWYGLRLQEKMIYSLDLYAFRKCNDLFFLKIAIIYVHNFSSTLLLPPGIGNPTEKCTHTTWKLGYIQHSKTHFPPFQKLHKRKTDEYRRNCTRGSYRSDLSVNVHDVKGTTSHWPRTKKVRPPALPPPFRTLKIDTRRCYIRYINVISEFDKLVHMTRNKLAQNKEFCCKLTNK